MTKICIDPGHSERMIPRGAEIVGKFRVPNRAQSGVNGYAIEYLIKV